MLRLREVDPNHQHFVYRRGDPNPRRKEKTIKKNIERFSQQIKLTLNPNKGGREQLVTNLSSCLF